VFWSIFFTEHCSDANLPLIGRVFNWRRAGESADIMDTGSQTDSRWDAIYRYLVPGTVPGTLHHRPSLRTYRTDIVPTVRTTVIRLNQPDPDPQSIYMSAPVECQT
jgi:hypothetical protein